MKYLLLFAFLISCQSENDETLTENPINRTEGTISYGNVLYDDNCLTCHGESGLGTPLGPNIENVSDQQIWEALEISTPNGMDNFTGQFTDINMSDIAAYIDTFRANQLLRKNIHDSSLAR